MIGGLSLRLVVYICKGIKWICIGYMILMLCILVFQQVGLISILDNTIRILHWIMLIVWFVGIISKFILTKLDKLE